MPSYSTNMAPSYFSPAATEEAVKACTNPRQPAHIICNLLELSVYLIDLSTRTNMFGTSVHGPYNVSVKTLYDRLQIGRVTISPLNAIAKDAQRLKKTLDMRVRIPTAERPLEDFEDLYYAVIARMKDMIQTMNVRLDSGFNTVTDTVYTNGPTIKALSSCLFEYWDALNEPACVRAFDDAIRQSRIDRLYEEINGEFEAHVITQGDADELLTDLFESKESTDGIAWITGWSPAMIGAWLEEKYLVLMQVEKAEVKRQSREIKLRAKMTVTRSGSVKKSRSRSFTKTLSIEKMLQKMDIGATQDNTYRLRPDVYGQPVQRSYENERVVSQHVIPDTNIDAVCHGMQRLNLDRDTDNTREWQQKSQRVSEYFSYLRGAASNNARSIVHHTKYRSAVRRAAHKGRSS